MRVTLTVLVKKAITIVIYLREPCSTAGLFEQLAQRLAGGHGTVGFRLGRVLPRGEGEPLAVIGPVLVRDGIGPGLTTLVGRAFFVPGTIEANPQLPLALGTGIVPSGQTAVRPNPAAGVAMTRHAAG